MGIVNHKHLTLALVVAIANQDEK